MESKAAVIVALVANAIIALSKFMVGLASGSSSMLSEAIHTTVDTGDQALLLLGIKLGKRAPDRLHPFGYGQDVYFWSTVVALLIFAFGGGMSILEGIYRVVKPEPLQRATWSYVVLAVAAVFEGASLAFGLRKLLRRRRGRSLWRTYRESKDPDLLTVVTEDSAALVGLLLAFLGIFLSHLLRVPWLEGAAACCIGALLVTVSLVLARETRSLLLGETAGPEVIEQVRRIIEDEEAVEQVGGIFTMHFGPEQILLNANVRFRGDLPASELEAVVDRIEQRVREKDGRVKRIFVEMESDPDELQREGRPDPASEGAHP